jgi:predicted phosphate transport protein (TIGR00153 family)
MKLKILDFLLPRETKFFTFLNQQTEILLEACKLFKDLVLNIETISEEEIKKRIQEIKECEHRGDTIENNTIAELHRTFITPLDREDIHDLTVSLDHSLDILDNISQKFEIYKIKKIPVNIKNFAELIVDCAQELNQLMKSFDNHDNMVLAAKKIHKIENKADYLFHLTMADLFNDAHSPVDIIKFKEIYEQLEAIVNSIDHIGKQIRGIKIKLG